VKNPKKARNHSGKISPFPKQVGKNNTRLCVRNSVVAAAVAAAAATVAAAGKARSTTEQKVRRRKAE